MDQINCDKEFKDDLRCVKCNSCGLKIRFNKTGEHDLTCKKLKVRCPGCKEQGPRENLEKHEVRFNLLFFDHNAISRFTITVYYYGYYYGL